MLVCAAIARCFHPDLVGSWIRVRVSCILSIAPRYVRLAFPSLWVKVWRWVCMVGVDLILLVQDVVVVIAGAW